MRWLLFLLAAPALAQTAGSAMPFVKPQFFTNTGVPAAGYRMCFYAAGTNNPQTTYQDSGLLVPNTNPIALDSAGRAAIFFSANSYKIALLTPTSTTLDCITGTMSFVWTQDNIANNADLYHAALIGPTGANQIGYEYPGATTPTTVGSRFSNSYVMFEDFGAKGDGVTDDNVAMQAAIDAACGAAVKRPIYAPNRYLTSRTLNMTTASRSSGIDRDGCRMYGPIYGIAAGGGMILGATGSGHGIFETTGSQGLVLEFLTFRSANFNPSTVGMYTGVTSTLTESQNVVLGNVTFSIASSTSSNSGLGSVGIWNFGSEEHTYRNVYINADRDVILTSYLSNPANYGNSYLQSSLLSSHSTGVTTFSGECFLVTWTRFAPNFTSVDVNAVSMENVYMATENTGSGSNDYAMSVNGETGTLYWHGLVEGLATPLAIFGAVFNANVSLALGSVANTSAPYIFLDRGQGWVENSSLSFFTTAGNPMSRPIVGVNPVASNDQILSYIANSTIRADLAPQYMALPENLLWNPLTSGVTLLGSGGYSYEIPKFGTERIRIGPTIIKTAGGPDNSGYIGQVVWPTTTNAANANAGHITVHVAGSVGIAAYGTTGQSATRVDLVGTLVTNNTGAVTGLTSLYSTLPVGTGADVASASNSVYGTGILLSTTCPSLPSATPCTTGLLAVPQQTGANSDGTVFQGVIEIDWAGWNSRAPSIAPLTGAVNGSSYTQPAQYFQVPLLTDQSTTTNAVILTVPSGTYLGNGACFSTVLTHNITASSATVTLNGTSAPLSSHFDGVSNISHAYTAGSPGGVLTFCSNGNRWVDPSQ